MKSVVIAASIKNCYDAIQAVIAGADSLAWCTGLAGRLLVLAAAFPLLEEICQRIWGLAA